MNPDKCEMDVLFERSVPHILIDIFLLLDPTEFGRCLLVCKKWSLFIKRFILEAPSLRRKMEIRRLVDLWQVKNSLREIPLEPYPGFDWSDSDIESASCRGVDVVVATDNKIMHFNRLAFQRKVEFDEDVKVSWVTIGADLVLVHLIKIHSCCSSNPGEIVVLDLHRQLTQLHRRPKLKGESFKCAQDDGELISVLERRNNALIRKYQSGTGTLELMHDIRCRPDSVLNGQISATSYKFIIAHSDGTADLTHLNDNDHKLTQSLTYSEAEDNVVMRSILRRNYHGFIFSRVYEGKKETAVSFRLFKNSEGDAFAWKDRLEAYGRIYFSVTDEYFIFSYADALHNQHFVVVKVKAGRMVQFVLLDRPQPMRSMQILRDKLLVLSFYRTASALNLFNLDDLAACEGGDMSKAETVIRLPQGVIAYQSNADWDNSQKLILYRETGLLCQRLNLSAEPLVLRLTSADQDMKKSTSSPALIKKKKLQQLKNKAYLQTPFCKIRWK